MADAELTLKQILDAPWTRRLARGVWIVLGVLVPGGLGYIAWLLNDSRTIAESAKADAAAVKVVQVERVRDQEQFQSVVNGTLGEIKVTLTGFEKTLRSVEVDSAETRGIVEQMQLQQSREALLGVARQGR